MALAVIAPKAGPESGRGAQGLALFVFVPARCLMVPVPAVLLPDVVWSITSRQTFAAESV